MEIFTVKNLIFTYPGQEEPALKGINLTINRGDFVTLCGKSGCGKSTLLRHFKPAIAPHGEAGGSVLFNGTSICDIPLREQSEKIGFVLQNADNQIVTDKVWHELAFGLESIGVPTGEIRVRVAEMASFFGIQTWFYKNVSELSGGQKQLLNLASVMVMQPEVVVLDEPTSQLDPIAAQEFIGVLSKLNRELGTTVILSEHRLEDAFAVSDRVVVMDNGMVIADDKPENLVKSLIDNDIFAAFPTPMRVYARVKNNLACPVTVKDGREWLAKICRDRKPIQLNLSEAGNTNNALLSVKNVWFRYGRDLPDVLKNLNLEVKKGEFYAIVGGNGTGKTTALSVLGGYLKPYRGKVAALPEVAMLPQNPQTLFVKKTVMLDLLEMAEEEKVNGITRLCEIDTLLGRHPYDLSGGEQQRAALAKVLLTSPKLLLLDEPTKGLDAHFKITLAGIIRKLKESGITIVMVSHDIEFCAAYADRCGMFFDGCIVSEDTPKSFFAGKSFYTTAANRMARGVIDRAVLADDIITAIGGDCDE